MRDVNNFKSLSTKELRDLLNEETIIGNFFQVKREYDSRFADVAFEITGPCHAILDEYFSPGVYAGPSHLFEVEAGIVKGVDVYEFMWCVGCSDYFGSSGYDRIKEGSIVFKPEIKPESTCKVL